MTENAKVHLRMLVELALSDDHFAEEEREWIYMVGTSNGLTEEEVRDLIQASEPVGDVVTLSDGERFDILYSIIQLMKIDKIVHLKEVQQCEVLAEKLGYSRKVIGELSSKIYSNPAITSDRKTLRQIADKHRA